MKTTTRAAKRDNAPEAETDAEAFVSPRVDITESREAYVLKADMPGVDKSNVELLLDGSELTITGRRSPPSTAGTLVYRESSPLGFRRTFELDPAIDATKVKAKMARGVLELQLPKAEWVKPRRITVTD